MFPAARLASSFTSRATEAESTPFGLRIPPHAATTLLLAVIDITARTVDPAVPDLNGAEWTPFLGQAGPSGSTVRLFAAWLRAAQDQPDETGQTVTVDVTAAARCHAHVFALPSAHATQTPAAAGLAHTTSAPNPPNLTPSWGPANNLWVAACASEASHASVVTGVPASYTDLLVTLSPFGSDTGSLATATRVLTAASEDPGPFSSGTTDERCVATVAVRLA